MALDKLYNRQTWHNNTTPALNETNLNILSKAVDDIDDRVVLIAGDILVTVPELQEMLEDCTELEQRLEAMTENPPYIGENGHWYIWDTDTGAYVDSGIDASITVEIADITMLEPNATPYVTNTGTDTDPIFHLFIPRGQPGKGISSIAKTGTSGYVDTYTITYTDGTTTTYTVTNGRNTDQVSTIPTASASLVGTIYQYIGASTSSYTHGFYYECKNVGGVYQWVNIPVGNDPVKVSNSDPYIYRQGKGNLADMEIVGASVAWNQLVQNGNFANGTTGWSKNGTASWVASDNVLSLTCAANNTNNRVYKQIPTVANHKYLLSVQLKSSENTDFGFGLNDTDGSISNNVELTTSWKTFNLVVVGNNNQYLILSRYIDTATTPTIDIKNVNVFDLTQDFGSATIADHIYSLEQAQAGSGIAWIKKYGFFYKDYFAYDAGSIQSGCIASRKVVGKNLLNPNNLENGKTVDSSGNVITNINRVATNDIIDVSCFDNVVVTCKLNITGANLKFMYALYDGDTFISRVIDKISGTVIDTSNATGLRLCFYAESNVVTKTNLYDLQLEFGLTPTAYEPYTETDYPFDSTKELRGPFSLEDGELKANGDVYTADGNIQRKYGIVNLGTLDWAYNSTSQFFWSQRNDLKISPRPNIVAQMYTYVGRGSTGTLLNAQNLTLYYYDDPAQFRIKNTAYTDAATFKTAMSGVYLVYELATPTTESAQPYQNPQRAYLDGTEEFIDGLTRDVMIPVGNNSVYQQDKVLPSIEDYVDAVWEEKADKTAIGNVEDGATASQAYSVGDHFYKDGKFCTVIANIASGSTFTLNTNYVEGTIAQAIEAIQSASARIDIDPSAATIAAYPVGTMYLVTQ